jgi:hypothetical protein
VSEGPAPARAGQFRAVPPAEPGDVGQVLRTGIQLIESLSVRLQQLDQLLLTGKPQDISEAAAAIDNALRHAQPAFADISATMTRLGASNLEAAAAQLRHVEQDEAASLAEALRASLSSFSKRTLAANKRAAQLNRGLNAALRSLQALGMQETGRLIGEA